MLSEIQIRQQIQRHVAGSLSLDDFEDWLASASWNMHKQSAREVQQLVGAVELRLAEYSQGHLDETELRNELQMILSYGCRLPVGQMLTFWSGPQPNATAISMTNANTKANEIIVVVAQSRTSTETRSASGRAVAKQETLKHAS